jgi:uncharacterized NAD(P)/FAD-binding protein YdhS
MLNRSTGGVAVVERYEIAIIGGGYAGAVLALHLARGARRPLKVVIVEPRSELGAGLAYSIRGDVCRLNAPAHKLGVSPEPEDSLLAWLEAEHPELLGDPAAVGPGWGYVARHWFATFVRWHLERALADSHVSLGHLRASATDIGRRGEDLVVHLSDGTSIRSARTVVTTSYGPPAPPREFPQSLTAAPGFINDPWQIDRIEAIDRDSDVLVIGTGLSMLDVAATLIAQRHRGRIFALSRHGLVARANGPCEASPDIDLASWSERGLSHYVKRVRAEIDRVEAAGGTWRDVFESLRLGSGSLWARLTLDEKRRFLRHLRSHYDAHRFRATPDVAETVDEARRDGRLQIVAGRIAGVRILRTGFAVQVAPRARDVNLWTLKIGTIVNCTGPKQKLDPAGGGFLGALIARGLARPDPLGLGLDVDERFRLTDSGAELFAISALTRARFGDVVGAPDIARQAIRLAEQLIADVAGFTTEGRSTVASLSA